MKSQSFSAALACGCSSSLPRGKGAAGFTALRSPPLAHDLLHVITVLSLHLNAFRPFMRSHRSLHHDDQSLIYQFYSVTFVQELRRTNFEEMATGGNHVIAN